MSFGCERSCTSHRRVSIVEYFSSYGVHVVWVYGRTRARRAADADAAAMIKPLYHKKWLVIC